ncbi:hypothetical protein TNCV_3325351, partial [Trichonephila clavipes]
GVSEFNRQIQRVDRRQYGTTNNHRTGGRLPCLFGIIRKNGYEEGDVEWNENGQ